MERVDCGWNYAANYQILLSFSLTELIDITLCVVFNGSRGAKSLEIAVKTRKNNKRFEEWILMAFIPTLKQMKGTWGGQGGKREKSHRMLKKLSLFFLRLVSPHPLFTAMRRYLPYETAGAAGILIVQQ